MSNKRSYANYRDSSQPSPYTLYGTPLPPLDASTRDDGSYVPPWKQEALDDRGRKRLHGAFTGGWSAGHFNTVGSKEGWTPAAFVSSRRDRAGKGKGKDGGEKPEVKPQTVDDFMDEEDLAEREERRGLEVQGGFAGLGGAERSAQGGMFADIFKTSGDTVGVKLLQRMGWRPGQGVGPKVKRRAKGDAKGEMHLFAPENSRMVGFERKTDRKGLGYAGEERLGSAGDSTGNTAEHQDNDEDARILDTSRSKVTAKPGKLKKKSGFGVGVLNDTGSDDEDPYAIGPQINYNRIIGGDRKKKRGGITASNATTTVQKPAAQSKSRQQRSTTLPGFRKCHDGRFPLDGFVLATAAMTLSESPHPPPTPPPDWKPTPPSTNPSTAPQPHQSTADAAQQSTHDPKSRAALLNEPTLPGKSVFDYLAPATRDKIALASGNTNLPTARGEGAPAGFAPSAADKQRSLWDLVPALETATATAALERASSGWTPYTDDEGMRARYRYFLELRAGHQKDLPARAPGQGSDDWAKELREFAQAALVFRPVSGLMAARFASSGESGGKGVGEDGEDPAQKAARLGMFGALTRSRRGFAPGRLVCKRFGVPVPVVKDSCGTPDGEEAKHGGVPELVSQRAIDRMMQEASWTQQPGKAAEGARSSFVSRGAEGGDERGGEAHDAREKGLAKVQVDVEKNEALEGKKAGDAVFKAIFGDDDSDED